MGQGTAPSPRPRRRRAVGGRCRVATSLPGRRRAVALASYWPEVGAGRADPKEALPRLQRQAVLLISDLQIAEKHHNFAKFKEKKLKEMSDADMASRASCCVSYCLSSYQLHRCSATWWLDLVPMLAKPTHSIYGYHQDHISSWPLPL